MRLQVDGSTQHTMPNTTSPVGAVEHFESPDDPTSSAAPERRESEKVITDWEEETRRLGRALALMELDFSAMTGSRWAHRFIISVGRVAEVHDRLADLAGLRTGRGIDHAVPGQ